MPEEIKQEGQAEAKPAGDAPVTPPAPNQGPSVEELRKQNEELQSRLKEQDSKIADLETTRATIDARNREIEEAKRKQNTDAELKARISKINERRAFDPDGADAEMASLLTERDQKIANEAASRAQQTIAQQTTLQSLKQGVKVSNPDFDDDIVELVMQRANEIAMTGKFKSAQEAVDAASKYVKTKLETYAQKKNAIPPLPAGAGAEGGGANQPPKQPEPPKVKTPLEELEEFNEARYKKVM